MISVSVSMHSTVFLIILNEINHTFIKIKKKQTVPQNTVKKHTKLILIISVFLTRNNILNMAFIGLKLKFIW